MLYQAILNKGMLKIRMNILVYAILYGVHMYLRMRLIMLMMITVIRNHCFVLSQTIICFMYVGVWV